MGVPRRSFGRLDILIAVAAICLPSCGTPGAPTTLELPVASPPWDPEQCPKSGIAGRYQNQGIQKTGTFGPADSRLAWRLNYIFKIPSYTELTVMIVEIDQPSPDQLFLTALDGNEKPIASGMLEANRRDYTCLAGRVHIRRKTESRGEGGGTNDTTIELMKDQNMDLEMSYDRKFESRPFFIPFRDRIESNLVFPRLRR